MKVKKIRKSVGVMFALTLALSAHASTTYEVKQGDNLWGISQKFLGDGERWREIYQNNQDEIENPNVLMIGQKLQVPEPLTKPEPLSSTIPAPEETPFPVPTTAAGLPLIVDYAALPEPPDPWCEPNL